MSLPANVGFGRVTGRLIRAILDDSRDPDTEPDGVPIEGAKITFTASVNRVVNRTATPPVSIFIDPVTVVTNGDGILVSPDGTEGVTLVASDDADLDPTGWTYKVTMTAPSISALSWSIAVPEGSVQDLATAIPVPSSPGSQLAAWQAVVAEITGGTDGLEALVDQAAASAGVAQAAASTASTARDQAQEARSGAESAAASAGAARDQAATSATTLNTWFLRGSGSPVDTITPASAGVQYVDTAQTCGARVWISTGTTASAWQVVNGDTSVRNISNYMGIASGQVLIWRDQNRVNVWFRDAVFGTLAGTVDLPAMPSGFMPPVSVAQALFIASNISRVVFSMTASRVYAMVSGAPLNGLCFFRTNQPWPQTLPGTPV